jgi:hypothetical protein
MSEWHVAAETFQCPGCKKELKRVQHMKDELHICETKRVYISGDLFQPGDFWFVQDNKQRELFTQ